MELKSLRSLFLVAFIMLAISGCKEKGPKFEFIDSGGGCGKGAPTIIRVLDGEIIFSGSHRTGNPCYDLSAELQVEEDNKLIVHIDSTRKEGICVQCVAALSFSGKIFKLKPGTYEVTIGDLTETVKVEG